MANMSIKENADLKKYKSADTVILDEKAMNRAIARISYEIIENNKGVDNICLIGILSRGVEIAARIANKIFEVENKHVLIGQLDITAYRDDKKSDSKEDKEDKTQIDFEVFDRNVILVDDVIFTGRSVRAAIEAVMERGRPRRIELAVLIDRGHRELPIRADFVGKNLPTSRGEKVKVSVMKKDGEDKVLIIKEEG